MDQTLQRMHPVYSVHPSVDHARAMISNLPGKTGKSIEEWQAIVTASVAADEKSARQWLKEHHGLGGTTAALIASYAFGGSLQSDPGVYLSDAVQFVEEMYQEPKDALWPIHAELIALGQSMGPDVRICPCKTIVPLYRNRVFAEIKPATRNRIDFGLALKNAEPKKPERLLDTGGAAKGDRITHRFAITTIAEIDAEIEAWCRTAYECDV